MAGIDANLTFHPLRIAVLTVSDTRTCARIASMSSATITLAASSCPAACSRLASSAPDVSVSSVRLSEMVSTAMRSG